MNDPRHAAIVTPEPAPGEIQWFERLLTKVSSRFIDWPPERIDEAIDAGLREIVEGFGIDRSTLSIVDHDTGNFYSKYSHAAPGFAPVARSVTSRSYPWVTRNLRAGISVVFSRLEELPPEADLDRHGYAALGLRSHVGMPVMVAGELVAVLGFGTIEKERTWAPETLARMRLLADLFGSALARKRAKERIDQLLQFERLLSDLSTSLTGTQGENSEAAVHEAFRAVAMLLRVDDASFWALTTVPSRLVHAAPFESGRPPGQRRPLDLVELPWVLRHLVADEVVNTSAFEETSESNGDEDPQSPTAGLRSLLAIPVRAQDSARGALVLCCANEARVWPVDLVARLALFGTQVANALAYENARRSAQRAHAETSRTRERLAHLGRVEAVGAMTAAVAHEITQPLMAITNYTLAGRRRLEDVYVDRVKLGELLEKISVQVELASEVLDNLRGLVKRRSAQEAELDVAKLLTRSLMLIEMEARRRGVDVQTVIAPDLQRALGDEIQVQQVILNLASNAMDAMADVPPGRRELRLEAASSRDDCVLICVADRGAGIGPDDEQKVFDPFYTTKPMGLGIGLSICQQIVEAQGGKLWHERQDGGGTVFRFTLPEATGEE